MAVKMAASAADAAEQAMEAATVADHMASEHHNYRWKLQRLVSIIVHRTQRRRVLMRSESRATRILSVILGKHVCACVL
jgi:thiamine biosynthesis protein ThiC